MTGCGRCGGEGTHLERLQSLMFRLGKLVWRDYRHEIFQALEAEAGEQTHLVVLGKAGAGIGKLARDLPFASRLILGVAGYGEGAMVYGSHPWLDTSSLRAGLQLDGWLRRLPEGDRLVAFVSGGGSASVDRFHPYLDQPKTIAWWKKLINYGLPIADLNRIRSLVSVLKNGQAGQRVLGRLELIVQQDIGGIKDGWRYVSGGHFVSLPWPQEVPAWLGELPTLPHLDLEQGWREAARTAFVPDHKTLQSPEQLAGQIAEDLRKICSLSTTRVRVRPFLDAPVEEAVERLVGYCCDSTAISVIPSETIVGIRGSGKGGRLCELLLRANLKLPSDWYLFAGASDGVDGNSGVSGGIIYNGLFGTAASEAALQDSDSGSLLRSLPIYMSSRATGANLCDQLILFHASQGLL